MKDLRKVKITKELVEKLNLRFTDRNMNLLNYETLTLESEGEFLRVDKDNRKQVLTDNGWEIIGDAVARTFTRNNMSGVYIEY